MKASAIQGRRIVELARLDRRAAFVLADLGISPRYLDWTLESATRDAGIDLSRVVDHLGRVLAVADRTCDL